MAYENILFEHKKKIMRKRHFVENKIVTMQHVLEVL